MSDTNTDTIKKKSSRVRKARLSELDEFANWLAGLGFQSAPKIHVNGAQYNMAVVVVDFGSPLGESLKLGPEQSAELIGYMRSITKSLYKDREVATRVQNDSSAGIWWSAIS